MESTVAIDNNDVENNISDSNDRKLHMGFSFGAAIPQLIH
jgi:hypothetical protein